MVRELGVGLIYWPELAPLFDADGLVDVLELEPQTLWEKRETSVGPAYHVNEGLLRELAARPQAKLLHGVGQPLGGTVDDPIECLKPWALAIDALDPAWISEHLSFNRVRIGESVVNTGFLLPPKQTSAAIDVAANNIRRFSDALRQPVAVETGVNYFKRAHGELSDGDYFSAVANRADCGILLDMHNLWCNEKNGRARVVDTLERLPLERVWEVHLAGGMELNGYRLDAHSDVVPPALIDLTAELMPKLPAVGAITFEILPSHLRRVGLDRVARQLENLQLLWELRQPRTAPPSVWRADWSNGRRDVPVACIEEAAAWEAALLASIRGCPVNSEAFSYLPNDPAIGILRRLIREARLSSITRALKYSITLLMLHLGARRTSALLDEYCHECPADPFVATEANHFATFLRRGVERVAEVPYLAEVLAFEHALVRATLFGEPAEVRWSVDPTALFAALDDGCVPRNLSRSSSTLEVTRA
jgi:uncharacterized protein